MNATGIVIVTWNSAVHVGPALDAALDRCERVVVVDNASSDRTLDVVHARPRVRLIANETNRGFAAAVNQGIDALDLDYVLLLNPDAVLLTGLEDLVAACKEPGVGAAGGLLLDTAGSPQTGFTLRRFPTAATMIFEALGVNRLWPSNVVNRRYRCLDVDLGRAGDAEQPPGAFLMIRSDAWRRLGGFNEDFHPLWFEDVDYLKRLSSGGWRTRFVPSARARHHGGHSVGSLDATRKVVCWYSNLLRYGQRHFRPTAYRAVCVAVAMGALIRLAAGIARQKSLQPVLGYGTVFQLASRLLFYRRPHAGGKVTYQSVEASKK